MQWGWSPTGIHVEHVDGWPGWKFQVTPTRDGGVARISMTAPPDHVITLDEFRRAPYGLLRRLCGSSTALSQASAIVPDPDALVPYSRKHLEHVATLYRFAVSQSTPATRLIAALFDVSARTAIRWVARARQLGMLDAWDQERLARPPRIDHRVREDIP